MRQITFKTLGIVGFRSYAAPVTFKFANTGLHLIKGLNGEGKTSLFSALVWCLYKVNLNDTNNSKIATFKWKRDSTWLGTRVQLIFGIGRDKYLVARHMDYKAKTKGLDGEDSLLIFKKEKTDKTPFTAADIVNDDLYKADQQAYLDRLLGIDSKTFLNSVLFGQRMARLMGSKDADKRDLFERLFDVDFIEQLKENASKKQLSTESILTQLNQDWAVAVNKKEVLEDQLNNANTILEEFKEKRSQELALIKADHTDTKEAIQAVTIQIEIAEQKQAKSGKVGILSALQEVSEKSRDAYYNCKADVSNVQRDVAEAHRELNKIAAASQELWRQLKSVKTNCPTCGAKLAAGDIVKAKESIEEQIKDNVATNRTYTERLTKLQRQEADLLIHQSRTLNAFTAALDAYNEDKQRHTQLDSTNELLALKQKQALLLQRKKQLFNAYNAEKERQPPSVNVSQINSQLGTLDINIPEFEKQIKIKTNYLKRLGWWQKTAFGANGLKAYVFSASLNKLNECISVYTTYFGVSIIFGVDLSKVSKPFFCRVILDGEHEVDYADLSGGQKQKIDLIISFAMQDAAEVKSVFNISIFDEPESGLDAEVLEVLDTLLRLKAEKKAVYVISHYQLLDLSGATVYEVSGGNKSTSVIE